MLIDLTQLCAPLPPPQGAPQGGLSCPFGAIHLQVAEQSEVGGGVPMTVEHSPSQLTLTAACDCASLTLWEGAKSERNALS